MNFIKLTEVCTNGTTKPLLVNPNCIQNMQVSSKGRDTHLRMVDKSFFFVKESLSEIEKMLNPPAVMYGGAK